MKTLILLLLSSFSAHAADRCLPIESNVFGAQRIEKNPATGKIQIILPYYISPTPNDGFDRELYIWSDYSDKKNATENICRYFGLRGGSSSLTREEKIYGRMLVIKTDGSYAQSATYNGYKNVYFQVECLE